MTNSRFPLVMERPAPAVPVPRRPWGTQGLTEAERKLMAMVAAGMSYKEIAREIGRSQYATGGLLGRIYKRLGAQNAPHAVAIAIRDGWISVKERS